MRQMAGAISYQPARGHSGSLDSITVFLLLQGSAGNLWTMFRFLYALSYWEIAVEVLNFAGVLATAELRKAKPPPSINGNWFCVIKGHISLQYSSLWGRRQRLPTSVPDHKLWITPILKEVEWSDFLITAPSQHTGCLHSNALIVSCHVTHTSEPAPTTPPTFIPLFQAVE